MDITVAGIGSVVVAQLRAAGYAESTVVLNERVIGSLPGSLPGEPQITVRNWARSSRR